MALEFLPTSPWHLLTSLFVGLMLLGILAQGLRNRWASLATAKPMRALILCLSLIAGLALLLAAWNPQMVERDAAPAGHLVVLLDISNSVQKNDFPNRLKEVRDTLARAIEAVPSARRKNATYDLITFGSNTATAIREDRLTNLPKQFAQLNEQSYARPNQSNLQSALEVASQRFENVQRGGAVLLISDGHETQGDALPAAETLAQAGIAIHVLSLDSGAPSIGIQAADLPRQVSSLSETRLRGILSNLTQEPVKAELEASRNPLLQDEEDHFGLSASSRTTLPLEGTQLLNLPFQFQGFGIQFLDLSLEAEGYPAHRRRFFTTVMRPPKILAIGGDQRWTSLINPEAYDLTLASPGDLGSRYRAADYDAVVISAVFATDFQESTLQELADTVKNKGVGLFLINGNHKGLSQETQTVLASYKRTPIEPLLPVRPGPRPFRPDPPPRQIVILVDTSGSMGGWRLEKAKSICSHIIQTQLRPKDTLDLLTFTTDVGHIVKRRNMDPAGKAYALGKVETLQASGGTDPRAALNLIANRRMTDCGLIFISDGQFNDISARPDCRATVFAIDKYYIAESHPLRKLADPFPVMKDFNPSGIKIPYFHPKPRKRFYEKEPFTALKIDRFLDPEFDIPIPKLPLPGEAVSYPRDNVNIVAVRPKLTDPVLAFHQVERAQTGVFTSAIPESWKGNSEAREAVHRWLRELVSFTARDRYDFKLTDRGNAIDLDIHLIAKDRHVPAVDSLSLKAEMPDGTQHGVLLRADPLLPGAFNGRLDLPRTKQTQRINLHLRELGSEALLRPQIIPMLLPPKGTLAAPRTAEASSYGTNLDLLDQLAISGGGTLDATGDGQLLPRLAPIRQAHSLVPYCIITSLLSLLAAFAIRRAVQ